MDVSKNSGTPKSSIFIGFSIINHPFWGATIFGNIHICITKAMVGSGFCCIPGIIGWVHSEERILYTSN